MSSMLASMVFTKAKKVPPVGLDLIITRLLQESDVLIVKNSNVSMIETFRQIPVDPYCHCVLISNLGNMRTIKHHFVTRNLSVVPK